MSNPESAEISFEQRRVNSMIADIDEITALLGFVSESRLRTALMARVDNLKQVLVAFVQDEGLEA